MYRTAKAQLLYYKLMVLYSWLKKIIPLWSILLVSLMLVSFSVFAHIYTPKLIDSLPGFRQTTIVIPFEYKQSALFQPLTFKVIDSVVNILLQRQDVYVSIEGYAHVDEGSDTICYYLSLNRAMIVKDYFKARGIDTCRIISLKGFGNLRSAHKKIYKKIIEYNCRAEILMYYPLPPPRIIIEDRDGDGIADSEDGCPDKYGTIANKGCPDTNAIIVPFQIAQSALYSDTYSVLDSVSNILLRNPSATIVIEGHAYKTEGGESACDLLAQDRAIITKNYLLSRNINASRIISTKNYGDSRPITAGRNYWEISRNARSEIYIDHH